LSISIPQPVSRDPLAIATALTTLLADLHNRVVAADKMAVIRHLLDLVKFSEKIKYWTMSNILDGHSVDARGRSFAQFVIMAMVCSEMSLT
jgi:hypothetical protein